MDVGANLEFARSEGMGLEDSLRHAHDAGYRFVEPYVYSNLNLRINSHLNVKTESSYHHICTAEVDSDALRHFMDALGLKFSALDVHTSLLLPQIGVPYLLRAIDFAATMGCPIVMSDEGPLPEEWMPLDKAFDILKLEGIVEVLWL